MMSVMSAQSTARNVPADAPNSAPPTIASGTVGASAAISDADAADDAARVDDGLAADPVGQPGARDDRDEVAEDDDDDHDVIWSRPPRSSSSPCDCLRYVMM